MTCVTVWSQCRASWWRTSSNFLAAVRATKIYLGHVMTGSPLVWDKTAHSYPIQFQQDAPQAHESDRIVGDLALELNR